MSAECTVHGSDYYHTANGGFGCTECDLDRAEEDAARLAKGIEELSRAWLRETHKADENEWRPWLSHTAETALAAHEARIAAQVAPEHQEARA